MLITVLADHSSPASLAPWKAVLKMCSLKNSPSPEALLRVCGDPNYSLFMFFSEGSFSDLIKLKCH